MDRILTTHVGSLIRPAELAEPVAVGDGARRALRRRCVPRGAAACRHDVVRKQAAAGLDIVDDGEFGKISWITYLYDRVAGIETQLRLEARALLDLPADVDREKFGEDAVFQELWRFADYWTEDYSAGGEGTRGPARPIVYDPAENDAQLAISARRSTRST